jgi:hypothetical protein
MASGAVATGLVSLPEPGSRLPAVPVPALAVAGAPRLPATASRPPAWSALEAQPTPEETVGPIEPPDAPAAVTARPRTAEAPRRRAPREPAAPAASAASERILASSKRVTAPPTPAPVPLPMLVAAPPTAEATAPAAPLRRGTGIEEPSLVFDTRAFVGTRNPKEQKAQLVLAEGRITIIPQEDPTTPLCSFPYERVLSIEVSRHRDPLWSSPQGPAPVARAGGMLRRIGIQVVHDWVALRTRTDDQFIAMRFDEVILKRVLLALEERTGRSSAVVAMPKDDERQGS